MFVIPGWFLWEIYKLKDCCWLVLVNLGVRSNTIFLCSNTNLTNTSFTINNWENLPWIKKNTGKVNWNYNISEKKFKMCGIRLKVVNKKISQTHQAISLSAYNFYIMAVTSSAVFVIPSLDDWRHCRTTTTFLPASARQPTN